MTALKHSVVILLAWIMYATLLSCTTICEFIGADYYFAMSFPPHAVAVGMTLAIYFAPWLAIPIVIRWKLKDATWGTFNLYMMLLSGAFTLQATRQRFLEHHGLSDLFITLAFACAGFGLYFLYRHTLHLKARFIASQQNRRQR